MTAPHHNLHLYCLVPDTDAARAVASDLSSSGLDALNLRVIAPRETLLVDLPEAGLRERSGILEAARRGVAMGSVAGTITGIVAAIELSVTVPIACGLVLFGCIGGSAFGAWASAMMGIEEPHSTIRPYQNAIESGQILIIIDATPQQRAQIEALIKQRVPAARVDSGNDNSSSD